MEENLVEAGTSASARSALSIWQLVFLLVVFFASQIAASTVLLFVYHGIDIVAMKAALTNPNELQGILIVSCVATAAAFLSVLVWFAKGRGLQRSDFGLVWPKYRWFGIALLLLPLTYLVGAFAEWYFGKDFLKKSLATSVGFVSSDTLLTIITAVMVIFLMPFIEELFFRATLYKSFRKYMRPILAGLLASAVFVVVHGQYTLAGGMFALVASAQITLLAFMLMWLYAKSGSLWPSYMLHATNNGIAFAAAYYYYFHSAV